MGTAVSPPPLTADEFESMLDELGWSGARLAREILAHPNSVTRWRKGEHMPGYIRAVLEPRIKLMRLCKELGVPHR